LSAALVAREISRSILLPSGEQLDLLTQLSLEVAAGSSLAVMGRSGSGKTTLLSILGLLGKPDRGDVLIAGTSTSGLRDHEQARIRNREIGFVFQSYSLIPHMTAAENVELPLVQGARLGRNERRTLVRTAMDLAQISHRANSKPQQLSGGEQQRAAIARALVRSPTLILADEPTGALDMASADAVLEVLTESALARGSALVIATHDGAVAARAHSVAVLEGGTLAKHERSAA
jgi:ABC-type lipoprotein export system ATPase subunit